MTAASRSNSRSRRSPLARWLATTALVVATFLVLSACATPPPPRSATPQADPISPSPYEVIGRISLVDATQNLAVVTLESHVRSAAGPLKARNPILLETATLEPTGQHSGRSLGVRILSGLPNIGDEVVRQQ